MEDGRWKIGEGRRGHGTGGAKREAPGAKRRAHGAYRLALNALRLPLGARPRLFPWIRGRSFTGNGTGLGPIVEIWGRRKLVGGMWLNCARLDGVRNKHRNQAPSGAACPTLGGVGGEACRS